MSLFTMKKYITLIIGILVSTHIYAESYVFGGRAHFQGVLINQSCSILIENNAAVSIKTPNSPIQINFSLCPVSIYDNLAIGLSEQNSPDKQRAMGQIAFAKSLDLSGDAQLSGGRTSLACRSCQSA